ncbi:unnamed protein product [Ilex paraguariensis]|uniref:NAD-dependent epimerase/dehydratase domain-containing protein n=1 Tax=Ilex paraguariensis TaxID=185542 RepID=A0ABC8UZJ4_9AQUA
MQPLKGALEFSTSPARLISLEVMTKRAVKQVVYTSGSATVMFNHKDQGTTDESTWTDLDFFRSLNTGYSHVVVKAKIDRVAWEFAEEHGFDLVTVVPPLVLGPFICNNFPGSVHGTVFDLRQLYTYDQGYIFAYGDDDMEK